MIVLKKIKATTIIESVVGMVILLIFIFIGMMVLTNINKGSNANLKVRAHMVSDYYIRYTIDKQRFFDEGFNDAGMQVKKTVTELNTKAKIIHIETFNADKKLILDKKVIVKVDRE